MKNEVPYPDWFVDREELKDTKKRTSCEDANQRMYSIFKCKYCDFEIDVATEYLAKHKKQSIDNHLSKCKSYMGERPVKRNKADTNFRTVILPCGNMTTTTTQPVSNTQQSNEMEILKLEMANLRESYEALSENHKTLSENHKTLTKDQEEMKGILTQHQMNWDSLITMLGLPPSPNPLCLANAFRELKQKIDETIKKAKTADLRAKDLELELAK